MRLAGRVMDFLWLLPKRPGLHAVACLTRVVPAGGNRAKDKAIPPVRQ